MSEHCEGCPKEADPAAMCLCDRIEALRQEHLNSVLPTLFALTARVALLESAEREVAALKARVEDQEAVRYGDLVGHHMHRLTVTALIDAQRGLAITCEDCESETICEAFAPAVEEAPGE